MDSISWKSSSVLWECMEKENYQIPANKDVEQRAEIAGVTPLKGDSVPNTPNGTRGKLIVREGGWRKIILFLGESRFLGETITRNWRLRWRKVV